MLDFEKSISGYSHIFETEVIDSGIGISQDQIDFLFEPFSELKQKGNISDVTNFSSGLGLSCSHDITKSLGGDIKVKHSQKGITIIGFKIPVDIMNEQDSDREPE